MRINEIVRLQEYMRANGREDYDAVKELLGGANKKDGAGNDDKISANVKQAVKDIVELSGGAQGANAPRTPAWDGLWTKREAAAPDEEIENSIKDLALEYAKRATEIGNSGKSKSIISKEIYDLNREFDLKKAKLELPYVSVVSPDRKTAYAHADFTIGNKVYGNETNIVGGNELMSWSPSGWGIWPTDAEVERSKKLTNIYVDTLRAYEAEYGRIPQTTITKTWIQ